MISTISHDLRASNDYIAQINIVFHRQNPTALYYHLTLWVLGGPCEDAPRLPSSAARVGPSR